MFDIGFAELLLVAVVGLLVLGPERLPEAIRTGAVWLNRLRRGFNDIKREIQQELHNDAIMRELGDTARQLTQDTAPRSTTPAAAAADGTPAAPTQAAADTPAAAQERSLPGGAADDAPAAGPTPTDGKLHKPERDAG